jgi:Taurine catabolism dioxygenase TauD, TfdA family
MIPIFDAQEQSWQTWLAEAAPTIRSRVLTNGAALVRGLPLKDRADVALARDALSVFPFRSTEKFGHRKEGEDAVVSPIWWPEERELCPYQEESFSIVVPGTVLMGYIQPPQMGGEVLLSDARQISRHLPLALVDRIKEHGWIMTRVFYPRFGISWQDAFDCLDREDLSFLLAREGIAHEWLEDGTLRTWRRRPAFRRHPISGEECWFNQLAFLNSGSLEARYRELLSLAFGDDLPVDTALGDGQPLSAQDLLAIQGAYDATTIRLACRAGDLLIIDNILTAQGRNPFAGHAEYWIAFGDPIPGHLLEKVSTRI